MSLSRGWFVPEMPVLMERKIFPNKAKLATKPKFYPLSNAQRKVVYADFYRSKKE